MRHLNLFILFAVSGWSVGLVLFYGISSSFVAISELTELLRGDNVTKAREGRVRSTPPVQNGNIVVKTARNSTTARSALRVGNGNGPANETARNSTNMGSGGSVHYGSASIDPSKFAIVQFDGRDLWKRLNIGPEQVKYIATHWNVAASWNWLYSSKHGHNYVLYQWENATENCRHRSGELAEPWCKVKSMLQVQQDFPNVDYFLYLDSDAIVDRKFWNTSMAALLQNMTKWLPAWNIEERPVVFNQEIVIMNQGGSWWCNSVIELKSNYTWCLNGGTVFWKRSDRATAVLERWWQSAGDPYETNPLGFEFRTKWPWEQDRLEAIVHDAADVTSGYLQVFPEPDRMWTKIGRGLTHGCLVGGDRSWCFANHFCNSGTQKKRFRDEYGRRVRDEQMKTNASCYPRAFLSTAIEGPYRAKRLNMAPCRIDLFKSEDIYDE